MARDQRLNCGFLVFTLAWTAAIALLGAHGVLLFLAPALLLALPLAFGRFLGENRLAELRARLEGRSRGRASRRTAVPRPSTILAVPRGGALIAAGLAKRPPPALVLA